MEARDDTSDSEDTSDGEDTSSQTTGTSGSDKSSCSDSEESSSLCSEDSGSGWQVLGVNASVLKPSGLFTLPVRLYGRPCEALVDSGASSTLIRNELVQGIELEPSSVRVTGLGSGSVPACGTAVLAVGFGAVCLPVSCLVVPSSAIGYDIILGDDFFKQYGVTIDLGNSRIAGKVDGVRFQVLSGPTRQSSVLQNVPVYTVNDCSVKSGEVQLVEVSLGYRSSAVTFRDDLQGMLFEPGPTKSPQSPHAECGIVDVCDGRTKVLVSTIAEGDRTYFIGKGTLLGQLNTIVDVEVNTGKISSSDDREQRIDAIELNGLEPEQADLVKRLLKQGKAAISQGDDDIGCAGVTRHRIELYDSTPIRQRPRRFPEPVTEEIERQCEELMDIGVIEYSKSSFSSPVVPIRKKDGSLRLCIDYRKLNKVTKPDRFPMPNMSDLIFGLQGTQYFTTLDLVRGYYQVPLDPETAEYTAFSTPRNHYQFKRLAFGLRNAPGAFQREMQEVLRGFDNKQVIVYIDDILILGRTFDEHMELVGRVLNTLIEYGMKIKLGKCEWFREQVCFLGHLVGRNGIQKDPEYVNAVQNFPKPENVKKLRSFLGLVNFQRKFIQNCSQICAPLNRWMGSSEKTKLVWDHEMEEAYKQLKDAMALDLQLWYPDYSAEASLL